MLVRSNRVYLCGFVVAALGLSGSPYAALAQKEPATPPEKDAPKPAEEADDGKVKIDPELQKRIDELLDESKRKKPITVPRRPSPTPTRPGVRTPGDRTGAQRPNAPKRVTAPPTRPGAQNVPPERDSPIERNVPRDPAPTTRQPYLSGDDANAETTPLNIPPGDQNIAPEKRTYRFGIKDGTYEQLVEGFARQTGLGVVGDTPKDGRVTFVTTEEMSFTEALSRVRMLLFNYKPNEPYWIERQEMNLRVIRVADIYRILRPERMFQSIDKLQAAQLSSDELALVIFTPQSGSVAGLSEVRHFMPDYVRVSPLEGQNRVTIFALKKDIDKYLDLIDFFAGESSDPRTMEKIYVKNLLPSEAIAKLEELIDLGGDASVGRVSPVQRGVNRDVNALEVLPEPEITIIPEDPQGYILVRAMAPKIDEIKEVLPWIDVKAPLLGDEPVVIPVEHANPDDLVATIQQILSDETPAPKTATARPIRRTRSRTRSTSTPMPAPVRTSSVTLFSHPTLSAVVVLGEPSSVDRVRELITQFDVKEVMEPQRLILQHASADSIVDAITAVLGEAEKGKPAETPFSLTPDPSGEAIWFTGTEKELKSVTDVLAILDVSDTKPQLRIVQLENALPSFVASILTQYTMESVTAGVPVKAKSPARRRGVKAQVTVAKFTPEDDGQRLFVLCTDDEWEEYEPLIRQLDSIDDDLPLFARLEVTHITTADAMAQLTPMVTDLIGPGGGVQWAPVDGAILVIGASPDQVADVRALLAEIDKPSTITQRTFEIRFADPGEIKSAIEVLVTEAPSTAGPRSGRAAAAAQAGLTVPTVTETMTIVQIENRLVVRSTPENLERIAALIAEFDVDEDETELRIYGDFPPGTDIASMAETLRTVLTSGRPITRRKAPPGAEGGIKDPRFVPQPASGKLVVIAQTPEFEQIEELLNVLRGDVEIDQVEVAYIPVRYAEPDEVIAGVEPLLAMQVRQWVASGELGEGVDASGTTPGVTPGARRTGAKPQRADRYYFVPDARNNRVVIAAPNKIIELARGLIAEFDTPVDEDDQVFRTVPLKNADAPSMVKSITELTAGALRRSVGTRKPGTPVAAAATAAPVLSITEAPGGGAVVLNGPKKDVEQAVEWIEHLDQMASRGREIKVFPIEHADLKRLVDLVMSVVDTPDPQSTPVRSNRVPRRKIGDLEEVEEDFSSTKTFNGVNVYVQADFVARTMLVATTETRMVEVEAIVAQFNKAPDPDDPTSAGMASSDIPTLIYDLKYRDAFDASWELGVMLSQVWEPSNEVPKVESALFGNSLIIKYPDESRFDEIKELIATHVDRLSPEDERAVKTSLPVPAGLTAKELALAIQAKHPEYDIVIRDITEKPKDHGLEQLKPYAKTKPLPCVAPRVLMKVLTQLAGVAVAAQDPDGGDDPASGQTAPPVTPPPAPARQAPEPAPEPNDFLAEQLEPEPELEPSPRAAKKAPDVDPDDDASASRDKVKAPKGEKLDVYVDTERGVLVVEGKSIVVGELDDWIEEIVEGIKDFPVKPDIRIYRVRYIDVHTAKDILEEMFNATKQQLQMIQQQQRAALQRERQQQQQQRQQQQAAAKGQQRPQSQQPQQPQQAQQAQAQAQVPQLPTATVRIYPHERDRALIIRAETGQFPIIEELLATIDRPKPIDSELKTFQLERLNAVEVEGLLTEILGLDAAGKTSGERRTRRGAQEVSSSGPGAQLPQTIMEDIAGGTGQLGIDPDNISISANEQTNSIVVMAPKSAIKFIGELIEQLDNSDIPERVAKYYELEYAAAEELADYLAEHFAAAKGVAVSGGRSGERRGAGSGGASLNTPSFSPYPRLNLLTVQATAEELAEIDDIVARFDVPGEEMNWEDVTLARGDAKQIAETLTRLYGDSGAPRRSGPQGAASVGVAKFHGEEGGRVLFMSVPPGLRDQVIQTVQRLESELEDKTKLRFVTLEFATASKVADAITEALDDRGSASRRGSMASRFSITAADGLRRLFVRADDEMFKEIESLAKTLDTPGAIGFEFRVFRLQYADAKQIHAQLSKLMTDYLRRLGPAAKDMDAFSVEVDERANALVVLGSPGIFGFLEENIPKFDNPENAKSPPGMLMAQLKTANAQEVAQVINRLWGGKTLPAGEVPPVAEANRSTNTLIVRGTQAQIDEIRKEFVDPLEEQTSGVTELRIYPVKHADLNGVVNIINQWSRSRTPSGGKVVSVDEVVTAVAEQETQSVVVSASEANHLIIKELLTKLDVEPDDDQAQKVYVMQLDNADAQAVSRTLNEIFVRGATRKRAGGPAISISAVQNAKAILVKCETADYEEIATVVAELDKEDAVIGGETRLVTLLYGDAGEVHRALKESMAKPGGNGRDLVGDVRLSALPQGNAILVTGTKTEVDRIERQLREMDEAGEQGAVPQVIVLQHAKVGQVLPALQELFGENRRGGKRTEQPPVITANEPNMLIVRASPTDFSAITAVVTELDTPERADKPNYRIIQVAQGVNVTDLAEKVSQSVNDGAQAQAPTGGGRNAKVPSITVTPDTRTSSLIVSGSPTLFDAAEELTRAMEKLGPSRGRSTKVIRLSKLKMEEIQPLIDQLTGSSSGRSGRSSARRPSRGNTGRPNTENRRGTSRPRGR